MLDNNNKPLPLGLKTLFATPSLMKGEDPGVYAELYAWVEEVAQPKDVWDQMMVADVVNHFWEQQRYRRCTGAVINSKRRLALEQILRNAIGFNAASARAFADIYFNIKRFSRGCLENDDVMPDVKSRDDAIAFLKERGVSEVDIDLVAMEASTDTLRDLENLALKHEHRREVILEELERRREKRARQMASAVTQSKGHGHAPADAAPIALPVLPTTHSSSPPLPATAALPPPPPPIPPSTAVPSRPV